MNYNKMILIVLIFLILLCENILGQPYIFTTHNDTLFYNDDTMNINTPYFKIFKINLSNNQIENFLFSETSDLSWDNTQTWLITETSKEIHLINTSDNNIDIFCPINPSTTIYSNNMHELFMCGTNEDGGDAISIINTQTQEEIFSLNCVSYNKSGQIFLSDDGNKFYFPFYDTVFIPIRTDKLKLAILATSVNRIVATKNFSSLGQTGADGYSLSNGRRGKGIIKSFYNDNTSYFNIYDFDRDSSSEFIYHKGKADSYFVENGKYLILNEIIDSLSIDSSESLFNTGKFLIYNIQEQKLIKTLQLPPQRVVYTFDNFPDYIYYYDDNSETAITLNIDSLVNNSPAISELAPAITFPGTENFTFELKGSKFTSNSVVMWNGSERTTSFVSDSILHASINTSDISSRSNSIVTVKTGYDISDTLMFTVVDSLTMPVHPILECVHNNDNGTYTAHFGYQNDLDKTVLVPIGGQNSFSPGQTDRGQTTIFYPGRHTDVFTVEFDGSNISWILDMQVKSANSNSTTCD